MQVQTATTNPIPTVQNLLSGSTLSTQVGTATAITYSATTPSVVSLTGDTIPTLWNSSATICIGPATSIGQSLTYTISLGTAKLLRTQTFLLSETTLNDPSFSAYQYKLSFAGNTTLQDSGWATGSTVVYNGGRMTYADTIQLILIANTTTIKFCLDNIKATDSHYLNTKWDYIYEFNTGATSSSSPVYSYRNCSNATGTMCSNNGAKTPISLPIPWMSTWSQHNCHQYNYTTGSMYQYGMKFTPTTGLWDVDQYGTVLLTAVLFQFGKTQQFTVSGSRVFNYLTGGFYYSTTAGIYTAQQDSSNIPGTLSASTTSQVMPSNYYFYLSQSPNITAYNRLQSQEPINEQCAIQNYGYTNCDFTISHINSTVQIPTGTVTKVINVTWSFNLGYTIGTVGVKSNYFCAAGLKNYFNYTKTTDAQSMSKESSSTGSGYFKVIVFSNNTAMLNQISTASLTVYDQRNQTLKSTTANFNLQYNPGCLQDDLYNMTFRNNATSTTDKTYMSALTNKTYNAYIDGPATFYYAYYNLPTCAGFYQNMTQITALWTFPNGTSITIPSQSLYSACTSIAGSACIALDTVNQKIKWNVNNEQMTGVNWVTLIPTLYGADGYGTNQNVSLTYPSSNYTKFTITIYSCKTTSFQTPYDNTTSVATLGQPNITTIYNNFALVNSANKSADANYPWTTKIWSIPDYLSSLGNCVPSFCCSMTRNFTITAKSGAVNSTLAQTLLACTGISCLKGIPDSTGYLESISVRILETQYINTNLTFQVQVWLTPYYTISLSSQPTATYTFWVYTGANPACTVANLKGAYVVQNSSSILTNITTQSYQDYSGTIFTLNYGLQNQPNCSTFLNTSTTYQNYIQKATATTSTQINSVGTTYTSCIATLKQSCVYSPSTTQQLFWYFFDETYTGTNVITITPTLYATDYQTNPISYTYFPIESTTFNLIVISCLGTIFQTPVDYTSGTGVTGMPNFSVKVFDSRSYKTVQVPDSYGISQNNLTYCGNRTFVLSISASNNSTQTTQATALLSNGNLTVTNTDGQSAQISFYCANIAYAPQTLTFTLSTYIQSYKTNNLAGQPIGTTSFTIQISNYTSCIYPSDLSGLNVVDALTQGSFANQQYTVSNKVQEGSVQFKANTTSLPSCDGYVANGTQTYKIQYIMQNGSVFTFNTTQASYTTCQSNTYPICTFYNSATNTLYWKIYSSALTGNATIYIIPTLQANDLWGNIVTSQYSLTASTQIPITVSYSSCSQTLFDTFLNQSLSTKVLQQYQTIKVMNFSLVDSTNYANDANFPYQIIQFQASDSLAEQFNNPSYCGQRIFSISVASNETNSLATSLLASNCTTNGSCIAINTTNGYLASLYIRVMEDQYADLTLTFEVTASLVNFQPPSGNSGSYKFPITIKPNNYCKTESQLADVQVLNATSNSNFVQQTYTVEKNIKEGIVSYKAFSSSLPTCDGYISGGSIIYSAFLIASDGITSWPFDTSLTTYNTCATTATGICLYNDQTNQQLHWKVFNSSIQYLNSVYIIPSVSALNIYNQILTNTYAQPTSPTFNLYVNYTSCMYSTFSTTLINTSTSNTLSQSLSKVVFDFKLVNSANYHDDANFPYSISSFKVQDSYAQWYNNYAYCGQRTFILSVAQSETQSQASELLATGCTSCLFVNSTDGYTGQIYLRVMDESLAGLTLTYTLTVYQSQYYSQSIVGQPSQDYTFTVKIIDNNYCWNTTQLFGVNFLDISTSQPVTYQVYIVDKYIEHGYIKLKNTNLPTCSQYPTSGSVTLQASLSSSDGSVTATFGTSVSAYNKCIQQKLTYCLYNDDSTLHWTIFGDTIGGINTVYLTPIVSTTNIYNEVITNNYGLMNSFSFTLFVDYTNCTQSKFSTVLYDSTTNQSLSSYSLSAIVLYYVYSDTNDKYALDNFPFTTISFNTTNTLSLRFNDPTYCDPYAYVLTVSNSETNPLASQLISDSCTSCLQVITTDGYNATMTLRIQDRQFTGLTFKFTLTVYFSDFYLSFRTQPTGVYQFTTTILPNPNCLDNTDLSGVIIQNRSNFAGLNSTNTTLNYLVEINQEETLNYSITNLPTCLGYVNNGSISFIAVIKQTNGAVNTFGQVLSDYDACLASALVDESQSMDCFYHDTENQELHWYLFSQNYVGINVIYIIPTLTGIDIYNDSISNTYNYLSSGSFTFNVTNNTACLKTRFDLTSYYRDFQGATIATQNFDYTVFTDLQQSFTYSLTNQPTCVGYDSTLTTYSAYVINQDGNSYPFSTNKSQFDSCVSAAFFSSCLYHDTNAQTLHWALFESKLDFINTVYIVPTLMGVDYYGNSLQYTYNQSLSGQFTLNVNWITCLQAAQFDTPIQYIDNAQITGMPDIIVVPKNYKLIDNNDLQADINYPYTYNYITISDSWSDIRKNSSWCGPRVFLLSVAQTETDPLAPVMLLPGCTSCLTVSTLDGYQAQIGVRVMDNYYDNLTLSFTLTVYLEQYYNLSTPNQPTQSYNFNVIISSCIVKNVILSPLDAQVYTYYQSTNMTALQFTVTRTPNCFASGYIYFNVNNTQITDPINTYGLYSQQSFDSNYKYYTIKFWSYYVGNTYLNKPLQIQMIYHTTGLDYYFGNITAIYTCQVLSIQIVPNTPISYDYSIGSVMTPITYKIIRTPPCPLASAIGSIGISAQGSDSSVSDFGLHASQSTDPTGAITTIQFSSQSQKSSLIGEFQFLMNYKVGNLDVDFPPIYANYKKFDSKFSVSSPKLNSDLSNPPLIPCYWSKDFTKWSYSVPSATDPSGSPMTYKIECSFLKNLFSFSQPQLEVYLNKNITTQPESGSYVGYLILTNALGFSSQYQINFVVFCNGQHQQIANENFTNLTYIKTIQPPIPTIKFISEFGVVNVLWDKPMRQKFISNVSQWDQPTLINTTIVRMLQQTYFDNSSAACQISILQRSDPEIIDPSSLNFTYSLKWINDKTTQILVGFNQTQYVSANSKKKDYIIINFNDSSVFKSIYGIPVQSNFSINMTWPKQMPNGAFYFNAGAITTASLVVTGIAFALSFIFSAILSQLLTIISSLTIIVHMFCVTLEYPINVQNFFGALFPLITFNLFPINDLYQNMFNLNNINDWALTDQLNLVGYSATLIISNMGSMYMLFIITPAIALILIIINTVCPCWRIFGCGRKFIQPRIDNYIKGLFWNGIFKFIEQNYIVLTMMSVIALTDLRLDTSYSISEIYNSVFAILIFILIIVFPILIAVIYWIKIGRDVPLPPLQDGMQLETIRYLYKTIDIEKISTKIYTTEKHEEFMKRYGILVEEYDIRRIGKQMSIISVLIPIYRKFIFVAVIIMWLEQPIFAIFCFNFIQEYYIIYIEQIHPFKYWYQQRVHIFTEYIYLIVNYHLFCLTDFTKINQQIVVGNSIIYFVIGQTCLMLVFAAIPLISQLKEYYKKRKMTKEKERLIEERRIKQELKKLKELIPHNPHPTQTMVQKLGSIDTKVNLQPTQQQIAKDQDNSKVKIFPTVQKVDQTDKIQKKLRKPIVPINEVINRNEPKVEVTESSYKNITLLKMNSLRANSSARQQKIMGQINGNEKLTVAEILAQIDSVGSIQEQNSEDISKNRSKIDSVIEDDINVIPGISGIGEAERQRLQRQIFFNEDVNTEDGRSDR